MSAYLLNTERPPVFCPGCSHERVAKALDQAFQAQGLTGSEVALVSDIGCSGLFDTFFHTHAMHGLHGRALTYATGLKMARPELNLIVTMGDGGLGIGGAHLLSACRRNLDMTLLVLNNFNFGMTGGQYSATTPESASVGSGFLNQLDRPMDLCQVARAAGAPYVSRCSAHSRDLAGTILEAIQFQGFAVLDIWGVCPGRYTRKNRLTPRDIEDRLAAQEPCTGPVQGSQRREYGRHYRELAASREKVRLPQGVPATHSDPGSGRREIILLGDAGQRVITAGELLGLAGLSSGLQVTQKSEYNITVLRGPSITEVILSPSRILFTGIHEPTAVLAVGQEGVNRRSGLFSELGPQSVVIKAGDVAVPETRARVVNPDFKASGIKAQDLALAAVAGLASEGRLLSRAMLQSAMEHRFSPRVMESALGVVQAVWSLECFRGGGD